MNMWQEFSTEFEPHKSNTEFKYNNITKVRGSKHVVSIRERGKLIHIGIFDTIEEAIDARDKYKTTGERSLKQKTDSQEKFQDLLHYYFTTTPPGITHNLIRYAHIECGNDIGFLINNPYFNIIEIP